MDPFVLSLTTCALLVAGGHALCMRAERTLDDQERARLMAIFRRLGRAQLVPFAMIAALFGLVTALDLMAGDPLMVLLTVALLGVLITHHVRLHRCLSRGALPARFVWTTTLGRSVSSAGLIVLLVPLLG